MSIPIEEIHMERFVPVVPARSATDIHPKVKAAGAAGAVATLVVVVLGLLGVELPDPEGTMEALAVALGALAALAGGYMKGAR